MSTAGRLNFLNQFSHLHRPLQCARVILKGTHLAASKAAAARACEASRVASAITFAQFLAVTAILGLVARVSVASALDSHLPTADKAAALTSFREVLIWRVSRLEKLPSTVMSPVSLWGGMRGKTSKAAICTCKEEHDRQPDQFIEGTQVLKAGAERRCLMQTWPACEKVSPFRITLYPSHPCDS